MELDTPSMASGRSGSPRGRDRHRSAHRGRSRRRSQSPLALPRQSTLFTSGTAWGPFASFNPLRNERSTGTVGLLYETLFRYDPLADKYIPWLATSGKWVGRTYVVTLRSGVKWNDGKPLTGADLKFTFETGELAGSEYSTMWKRASRGST